MSQQIKEGYTRVTEVLSPFNKFENIPPDVLERACERGRKVHKYCEMYMRDEYFPEPCKELQKYLNSFSEWHEEMVDRVLLIEWRGYNDLLRITGQIDLVCILKGDETPSIIDIKTSSVVSKGWALQLAAYKHLYNQAKDRNRDADRRIVVQLSKEGKKPIIHEYTDHKKDWELYSSALQLWRFYNGC